MSDLPTVAGGITVPASLIYHSAIPLSRKLFEIPSIIYVKAVQFTREHHFDKAHPDSYSFCVWGEWADVWGVPLSLKSVEFRHYADFPQAIHGEILSFKNKDNRVQSMILEKKLP